MTNAQATLGAVYCSLVLASSLVIRRPPAPAPALHLSAPQAAPSVHVDRVASTPQFWLLFSTTALLCTGGNTQLMLSSAAI